MTDLIYSVCIIKTTKMYFWNTEEMLDNLCFNKDNRYYPLEALWPIQVLNEWAHPVLI